MKFINKWYFIAWIVFGGITLFFLLSTLTICPFNVRYDEDKLMELCGVTSAELVEASAADPDFCPNHYEASIPCGISNAGVAFLVLLVSMFYNIIYALIYLIKKYY